ncbi:hypothetical protein L4C38_03115 [Vibrio kasasachensis]|uniref:DUF4402 domain-containing protein n=1 Tax=Vibrio kasasachensis TaxID=2910248 RepID=UPI003D0F27E4
MKNLVKVVAVSALALSTSQVMATATDTFQATLEVKPALTIEKVLGKDLKFPAAYIGQTGTIEVPASHTDAAQFDITGPDTETVDVVINNSDPVILNNGGNTIPLALIAPSTHTFSGSSGQLLIGGTIDLTGITLVAGTYTTGAIDVAIKYQ